MDKKEALVWLIIAVLVVALGFLLLRGTEPVPQSQTPPPVGQLSPPAEIPAGEEMSGELPRELPTEVSEEIPDDTFPPIPDEDIKLPGGEQKAIGGILTAKISIEMRKFIPDVITIEPGTQVTWINNDSVPHKIVEYHRKFYGYRMQPGDSFSVVFSEPGVYTYYSANFPKWGKGKIIVGSPENEITGNVVADLAQEEDDSKFALLTLLFVVLVYSGCVIVHRKRRY